MLRNFCTLLLLLTIVCPLNVNAAPAHRIKPHPIKPHPIKPQSPKAQPVAELRNVVSLDGDWDIAEGTLDDIPTSFDHTITVPGLVDMATPAFQEVGQKSPLRAAFWYHRVIRIPGKVPLVAMLKVSKAAFGSQVYLNGELIEAHPASFTPALYDLHEQLHGDGAANDLVIRVGASPDVVPAKYPTGFDFQKQKYIPGIFDSVQLILSGAPNIVRVQLAPNIKQRLIRVRALIHNSGPDTTTEVSFTVREARSGAIVGTIKTPAVSLDNDEDQTIDTLIPIQNCQLWSPEDPFLYTVETRTSGDDLKVRFGMREFHLDPTTGRAFLNGQPYYLRGSNITLYRFFEDSQRGALPWNADWVRKLHRSFKGLHWNSLRYSIGFPPELWYEIADEEGFLIEDEFPLYYQNNWPPDIKSTELASEYTEWIQDRGNHPCVVIWDAQNESNTSETGTAIQAVRGLDLSNRPWDNGWGAPQAPGDSFEAHPYYFSDPRFRLSNLATKSPIPTIGNIFPDIGHNVSLINEYGWLWLNRDGTPTTLTSKLYNNLLGNNSTTDQRRYLYAHYLAAETEFWRCHRNAAGVMQFCALGMSGPSAQTSDLFVDVPNLVYEPQIYAALQDAFAPTGLMLDFWDEQVAVREQRTVSVITVNDLYQPWQGTVRLRMTWNGKLVTEQSVPLSMAALGTGKVSFSITIPNTLGAYELEAALIKPGSAPIRSAREFTVVTALP